MTRIIRIAPSETPQISRIPGRFTSAGCRFPVAVCRSPSADVTLATVRAFYSDHFVLPLPEGHTFPMAKYARLRERVIAEGIVPPERADGGAASQLGRPRLVHTADYVEAVADGHAAADVQRRIGFPWSPEMVERSRRSVGATIAAARAALAEAAAVNLAGGTHHAFADRGEGYCVFNDVAVGARVLQRDHGMLAHRDRRLRRAPGQRHGRHLPGRCRRCSPSRCTARTTSRSGRK